MNDQLWNVRVKSFGFSLLGLAITSLLGFLVSEDFATLVKTNFGEGLTGTLVLLLVTESVKHLRNLAVTKKLGSSAESVILI